MSLPQTVARRASGLLGRESWVVRRLRPVYESLLDWQGRGIEWEINGELYRVDPRYRHRLGHNYDGSVAAFLRERVAPGALCLDVGANVGVYVLQFARWSGPSGRVVAFEPNPWARAILDRHVRLNGLAEQVTVVEAAVGARGGEAVLFADGTAGMSRLGAPNEKIADRVTPLNVSVITLDHYYQSQGLRPDWLFVDIEGFEFAALEGARELIHSRRGSLGIIVEMHPNVWESADTTRDKAEELLAELGLSARPLTGQVDSLGEHGLVHLAYS